MKKRYVLPLLAILVVAGLDSGWAKTEQLRIISDMDNRQVEVPVDPQRIACLHGVSSDRIIMLGKADSLVLSMQPSSWALKFYPELKNIEAAVHTMNTSAERLISLRADLVMYSPNPREAEKFRAAGLHTACGFSSGKRPRTLPAFFEDFKHQVSFFGDLLGPEANRRAQTYCRYFDKKMAQVMAITSALPENERPKVYYGGRSSDLLGTQGRASVMHWVVEVAGGNFVSQVIDANFAEANFEQVLTWDPDVILISGWGNTLAKVKNNPNWSRMRAVKQERLYMLPTGIFAWEYASGETVLLIEYLAKILHPERFADLDMLEEAVTFYHEVYGKEVSREDADRILKGLPPL